MKPAYGLCLQIVLDNMVNLLKTDAQMQCMLTMKKIAIKELEETGRKNT